MTHRSPVMLLNIALNLYVAVCFFRYLFFCVHIIKRHYAVPRERGTSLRRSL